MNWKTWVPLVLAVALGLVAMKVARDVMNKNVPVGNSGGGARMVVLKRDVPAGQELTAEDLDVARVAAEVNPAAVFTEPEAVKGRVMSIANVKGSPVLEAMLAPQGKGSGMQALIPDGMRAITLEINEITGVAGNLVPGCRVDVIGTLNGEQGEMLSRTVVQNVKVQALGMRQAAQGDNPGPTRSVTLLASPKEAEAIELAATTAKPRLVLRSGSDFDSAPTEGVSLSELRGGSITGDPFQQAPAVVPAINKQASGVNPATQPEVKIISEGPVSARSIRRSRQVKIIRGGVESETVIEEQASPFGGRWITNLMTDEVPGTNEQ